MKEYILEFTEAVYNEETGEAVFKPKYKGELIRCKDCKHNKRETWVDCDLVPCLYGHTTDHYCSMSKRKDE